ncbi:NAD(P)H-quinone oxidoreductase [Aestuariispira insulae]|uniref:Putative PIG3 family NAD(P)H quinone oxidoreductase n=1 Tax=Aestuariispira insulae TaxID=1461337 RepID=A0A3D9HJV1_9PROT|nr:NAD(P)H-quinone oxidoreductase [Aestuariispira insulae]RED49734.1 putative PIG3 family NAD(P)H quinone oxidoreductase [Aestuariispira insulae]
MSLPDTMRVVEITEAGGPEVLKPAARPVPKPGPGQVLIQVSAAGVNRPDCLQRAGLYPPPKDASDLPGLEVAGTVAALGDGVTSLSVGEAVCALTPGGGYAEYCLTHHSHCLPLPKDYDMVQAAALPETFFTVWSNIFDRARLVAGESLLVHGGSSGIGSTAIQLAKAFGAHVIVTVGNEEKSAFCRNLGADHAINYKTENWVERVKEITGGKGVNVVFDMVAGDYIQGNIDILAVDGRYALLAFLKGPKATVNFRRVLTDRLTISGSTLRPQSDKAKGAIASSLLGSVWPLLDSGKIKPVIHATFPLEKADEAHALMESSAHMGKIMLAV